MILRCFGKALPWNLRRSPTWRTGRIQVSFTNSHCLILTEIFTQLAVLPLTSPNASGQMSNSGVFPASFCGRRTRNGARSLGIYTTRRGKISWLWQRCLVNSETQSLRRSKNYVRFLLSVRHWRNSASVKSARFLTFYTRLYWTTLDWKTPFVTMWLGSPSEVESWWILKCRRDSGG